MSLVDLNPAGLNLASLKPTTATSLAQEEASQVQADTARVQLANAQDEQQRNQAMRARLAAVAKAPSVEAYTELLAGAPREYVEGIKASIAQMDSAAKKTLEAQILPAWTAGVNGRPDLQKEEMEKLAAGYESMGKTDKAAGIRRLLAEAADNPDIATTHLGAMFLEAAGPERFKALTGSLGLSTKRRKDAADALLAEANADPARTGAALREQIAKAKSEEAKAGTAEELAAAQLRTAKLEASLKATEDKYKEQKELSGIAGLDASAYRDRKTGDRAAFQTEEDALTQGDRVAQATASAQKERALADQAMAGATPEAIATQRRRDKALADKAVFDASPEAQAVQLEKDREQVRVFKSTVKKLDAEAETLPAHVQDSVLAGTRAARESQAAAIRARTAEREYQQISAADPKGTSAELRAWGRKLMGTEGKRDALNQLAERIKNEEVINQAQKIRPVSDTDMEILRKGLPATMGNPKLVAEFMGALARAQEKQASVLIDEAAWQAAFRGPNNATRDAVVNGLPVKQGMSFPDFMRSRDNPYVAMSDEERSAKRRELADKLAAAKAGQKK